jgi:hypothetical protein
LAVGGAGSNLAITNTNLTTYQGSAGVTFGNFLNARLYSGTPSSQLPVPANRTVYSFLAYAYGDSQLLPGAGYRARTIAATSAVPNIELQFFVGDSVNNFSSGDQQLRVRRGAINFQPKAAAPASPAEGDVYYDSVLQKLRCYNGTIWNDLF